MKKRRKYNLPRITLTIFIIIAMVVVAVSLKNIFSLRAEQKELKSINKALLAEKASLQEELKNVNDFEYIEEQARIQLRLVKPGEILYILEDEDQAETDDKAGKDSKN
ncbi:MAG: septum formation initiator family protein [Eubacteriaceae bacterium]|nr:septum formation initiator family protein [Eubacteriaceae bacterium]